MKQILLIFLGGGLGSICRYGFSSYFNPLLLNFPLGTFLSNLLASLLLGMFFIIWENKSLPYIIPLFIIGFCGGFSTFSTFSFDNLNLLKEEKFISFTLNVMANVVLCLTGVWIGLKIGTLFQ